MAVNFAMNADIILKGIVLIVEKALQIVKTSVKIAVQI